MSDHKYAEYVEVLRRGAQPLPPAQKTDAPRAINPSCFSSVDGVSERVSQLAGRLDTMADRLAGIQPENPNADGRPTPNGLFDGVENACARIDSDVERMHAQLDRLEKRLP